MFSITRRSRLIAGLATTAAVALVPAATSSAADAPPTKALHAAPAAKQDGRKASPEQSRKALQKLKRVAKRAGLVPTGKAVGRGYFVNSSGYACFYAPAWDYTICFGSTGYGSGDYEIWGFADSIGRSGYIYVGDLVDFLLMIGG